MKHTIKTNEILTTTQQKNYKKLNAGAIVLLAAIAFSVIGLVLVVAVRTHVAYMLVDTIQRQATQSNWYNPAWQYRRQITISNINDPVQLQNYQVSLQLNAANFTFANAQPNGSDIRFTDSD